MFVTITFGYMHTTTEKTYAYFDLLRITNSQQIEV